MGGSRSGRNSGVPVIEHGLKVDLRWLKKRRLFRPGFWHDWTTLSWSSGARIGVRCFDGSNAEVPLFHLRYWVDGQRIEEAIRLERFPQHTIVQRCTGAARWSLPRLASGFARH
jgi:hypothetical protein